MAASIHPTAVVDPTAELADGVVVGPHAFIGPRVSVGEGTEVGAGAAVQGLTRIGRENRIFPQAAVGFEPQDLKFGGEETWLELGDRNVVREFVTLNRGTGKGGGLTRIGDENLFMAYSHVGHDCRVGSRVVFANGATLAGHVEVEDDSTVSASTAVHQFCRVGRHAYVGGFTVLTMDALPFAKTVGHHPAFYGINKIGLERKGLEAETIRALSKALKLLTRSGLNTTQALERIEAELAGDPEITYLVAYVRASQRGIVKHLPGRRGARGGEAGVEPEPEVRAKAAETDGATVTGKAG